MATGPAKPCPGRWECRTAQRDLVDCDAGPVLTATFLPDTPLAPGYYLTALNPEHVLSVTDLAGNPASSEGEQPVIVP